MVDDRFDVGELRSEFSFGQFGAFKERFANWREAFLAGLRAHDSLKSSWIFALSRRNKKDLETVLDALLHLHDKLDNMEFELQASFEKQNQFLSDMETVRDRNRRLEKQMQEVGLSNAQINGNVLYTDSEWQKAIREYVRSLAAVVYYRSTAPEFQPTIEQLTKDLYELSSGDRATLVGRLVWGEIARLHDEKQEQDALNSGG